MINLNLRASILSFLLFVVSVAGAADDSYAPVDAIFSKYCLDCHGPTDPEGKLVLDNFEGLMKGGEDGPVIVPAKSDASLLLRSVEGTLVKDGKKRIMPPGAKRKKLDPVEIATIRMWIEAGAHGPPLTHAVLTELTVPKIGVKGVARNPINVLLDVPRDSLMALGRYGEVELRSTQTGELQRTLAGHHGNVNALALSPDGRQLFAGSGEAVRFGEIKQWNMADGSLVRTMIGHKDAVYALAISPDGKILASGSYDQKIKLWDTASGQEMKTLSGHNGAIFGLAFRSDGRILASASADHTVKLWDVATGQRRDTLSQPLKEVFAVAFSPDGTRLAAAGGDNRIRVWEISRTAAETTNPLLESKFSHDGAILRLVFSPDGQWLLSSADDRTVRLWDFAKMKERTLLEKQPDWAAGLDFIRDGKALAVGRLDGSLGIYDLDGKSIVSTSAAPVMESKSMDAKPIITRIEPRGMQRGTEMDIKVYGTNLLGLTAVKFSNPKLSGRLMSGASSTEAHITVRATADLPRGVYDVSLANTDGESKKVKLNIDQWPQIFESQTHAVKRALSLPVCYWGAIDPSGITDEIPFHAQAGQTVVFDLDAESIGSRLKATLTLLDAEGNPLASQAEFDNGDPLLAYSFSRDGSYRIRVADARSGGSPDYYYRLSMGTFPMVTSVFPPSLSTNTQADLQLIGYNLAGRDKVRVQPTNSGVLEIPLDPETYRFRRPFNILVTEGKEMVESEPNDTPDQATAIPVPCTVSGRINPTSQGGTDVDLYRFQAKADESFIIETDAARRGSPIDTRIEVLHNDGSPVKRLQLQAVRDSAINFSKLDSKGTGARVDNWQEMEINQYLYMQGEVCKIFRMPQGPDSGIEFYPSAGARRDFFDTSATAHPVDQPCYIVEPHPPDEKLAPNGLPILPLYYVNDDDGDRQLGVDSRLHFTAPAAGAYLIRVTDNRGWGGDRFWYRLIVRAPHPDFDVTLSGANPAPSAGAGRDFTVNAKRLDGFDGDIHVEITGAPAGFRISSPLVIQASLSEAKGTVNCDSNSVALTAAEIAQIKVTARAWLDGAEVTKSVPAFDAIKVGEPAKLWVALEPYDQHATNFVLRPLADKPLEITIAPGASVPAWIKVERHGFEDVVTFSVENLPHGVIVDNIGLNGVLIPKDESHRKIFLQAAKWVPDTDCLVYVRAAQANNPSSLPVLLHVRGPSSIQSASAMK